MFDGTQCTVPFTLVYAGKYGTEIRNRHTIKTENPEEANNTKNSKTKL